MREPVAYFLTWSCYGNWLHGDERGSVDREHNIPGTPLLPSDPHRKERRRRQMIAPPARFSRKARDIITETITEHCRMREWELFAVNARTNHIHVVVGYAGMGPENMMGQLKAWASRRLREAGLFKPGAPIWTQHGSTRYIWYLRSIPATVAYVLEGQDVPH